MRQSWVISALGTNYASRAEITSNREGKGTPHALLTKKRPEKSPGKPKRRSFLEKSSKKERLIIPPPFFKGLIRGVDVCQSGRRSRVESAVYFR